MTTLRNFLVLSYLILALSSCKKDETLNPEKTSDELVTQILADFGTVVAEPTYSNLHAKAVFLAASLEILKSNPTAENLTASQNLWFATRTAWEQSECMLFGPVATEGLDPAIDTWPVSQNEVDSLLQSSAQLGTAQIDELGNGLKGFHPVEYLLFGQARTRKISDLSSRQLEYLAALGQHLIEKTEAMHHGWMASGGNYSNELAQSGRGSQTFATRQDGLLEIAHAITGIISEVGEAKIQEPFAAKDSLLEESPFALNSWNDFKDNLLGAKNTYMGTVLGNNATSIHQFVKKHNASLDLQIQQGFDQAIGNLTGFTVPFGRAIFSQPSQIQATQANLSNLKDQLESQMIPLIQLHVKN